MESPIAAYSSPAYKYQEVVEVRHRSVIRQTCVRKFGRIRNPNVQVHFEGRNE